jgi:hypothetical protein
MNVLLYIGSIIIILWGIGHLIPTRSIVRGFGELSEDNKKILIMELIAEGVVLVFTGLFPLLFGVILRSSSSDRIIHIVYFYSAILLLVMAILTAVTGARTSIIWYKICPVVKTVVAILFLFGSLL